MACRHPYLTTVHPHAVGVFKKREGDPLEEIRVPGAVKQCSTCRHLFIVPFDSDLSVVEVDEFEEKKNG